MSAGENGRNIEVGVGLVFYYFGLGEDIMRKGREYNNVPKGKTSGGQTNSNLLRFEHPKQEIVT